MKISDYFHFPNFSEIGNRYGYRYVFGQVGIGFLIGLFFGTVGIYVAVALLAQTFISGVWSILPIFVPFLVAPFFLNGRYQEEVRLDKLLKDEKDKREHGVYWKRLRADFPIIGHPEFVQSVNRVLDELRDNVPERYKEALAYFPQAKYDPSIAPGTSGRSDGIFSIDGSGSVIGKDNSYLRFRKVFLHEVGHCIHAHKYNDHTEDAADKYAYGVMAELNSF